jgi:hypothetical protein
MAYKSVLYTHVCAAFDVSLTGHTHVPREILVLVAQYAERALRPFYVGQWLDVRDSESNWLEASIVNLYPVGHDQMRIHYSGWKSKYDEDLSTLPLRMPRGLLESATTRDKHLHGRPGPTLSPCSRSTVKLTSSIRKGHGCVQSWWTLTLSARKSRFDMLGGRRNSMSG